MSFIDWQKLKNEWKTFSLGVVTVIVGAYDAFIASALDYTPIIPIQYREYAPLIIGVLFLSLRKYKEFQEKNV